MSLKSTPQYKKWKQIVMLACQFPIDDHLEELKNLHSSRVSRSLMGKVTNGKLIQASSQDVGIRSRAIELLMQAKRLQYSVNSANEAIKDFALKEKMVYGSTVAERNRVANSMVQRGIELESKLSAFIEVVGDLIDDIDKTSWALKLMMEGLVSASKPEYVL